MHVSYFYSTFQVNGAGAFHAYFFLVPQKHCRRSKRYGARLLTHRLLRLLDVFAKVEMRTRLRKASYHQAVQEITSLMNDFFGFIDANLMSGVTKSFKISYYTVS